jgi:NAD+ diphosphatase
VTALDALALSRATVDRDAERRTRPDLVAGLLADPATTVLVLTGGRVLVEDAADGVATLSLLTPPDVPPAVAAQALALYLGRDAGDPPRAYVALVLPDADAPAGQAGSPAPDADGVVREFVLSAAGGGRRWATLREVGALLDDTGAGLFTAAVALGNWHAVHPRCSRCGTPTLVAQAGWARSCPQCGAEHYPRTDPAVIMAVVDDDGRLLLGRQASWPEKRYSTLAGFVEPGESLEAAVRREVAEESGVVVGEVEYRGSQPWPFPSSLMLGFRGRAVATAVQVDGVELAHARWWTREEFEADLASGELMLPPRVSIARRLIEDWYGGPVSDGADWGAPPGR